MEGLTGHRTERLRLPHTKNTVKIRLTRSYPAQKESVDPLEILTEFLIRFYKAMVILPEF